MSLHNEFINKFIPISIKDSKTFSVEKKTWIFELLMNSRIHECKNFIELYFNQQYNRRNVLLLRWMKLSANENYFKYYSIPFPRFHSFSFYSFLWVWLTSQKIRFSCFLLSRRSTFTPFSFPLEVILSRSICFCFQI